MSIKHNDTKSKNVTRTIDQPITADHMVKPGELVDIIEMTPLTLADRRIYNLLLAHAWDKIEEPITHVIAKKSLRGSHNVNDRIGDSIERLMAAIVRIEIDKDGKKYTRRFQLIAGTDEALDPDGMLHFNFDAGMRAVIRNSKIFARIRKDVMFALSSKYALALYEMVQKRGNLKYKFSEEFTLERFRDLLGMENGRLPRFADFNRWAIKPAVLEVNGLSDFGCKVEPVLEGRKVVGVRLSWWAKEEDELKAAHRELQSSKIGRRARLTGTVENITEMTALPAPQGENGEDVAESSSAFGNYPYSPTEKIALMRKLKHMFPDYDIKHFEREFQTWLLSSHLTCNDYESALIGFIKKALEKFKSGK